MPVLCFTQDTDLDLVLHPLRVRLHLAAEVSEELVRVLQPGPQLPESVGPIQDLREVVSSRERIAKVLKCPPFGER